MAFYRGEQGTIKFDKDAGGVELSEIASVRSWSMTIDKESLEVTDHGDTFRSYVGGLIGGSGTLEVLYDAPGAGDKLDLIKEVVTTEDPANAELELYLDESGGKKITFTALITNAEYAATVGELEVISINFTANGTITLSI
mgnify:FL=1|tara:strand:+ start:2579 stop:3001 length:423 start_codon:yes stop_codon:yes gene_type:complete